MSEELKTCPFCGRELEYCEFVALKVEGRPTIRLWAHPAVPCILAGLEITEDDREAWNRRAG